MKSFWCLEITIPVLSAPKLVDDATWDWTRMVVLHDQLDDPVCRFKTLPHSLDEDEKITGEQQSFGLAFIEINGGVS
jgi:hypothetical protein